MSKYYIELKTTSVSRWEVEAEEVEEALEAATIGRSICTGDDNREILRETAVVRDENFNVILRLFKGEDNKWKKWH